MLAGAVSGQTNRSRRKWHGDRASDEAFVGANRLRCLRTILWLAVIINVFGCDAAWNRANRGYAREALQEAFRGLSVSVENMSCAMIATTRSFSCTANISPADIGRLRQSLAVAADAQTLSLTGEVCAEFAQKGELETFATVEQRPANLPGLDYLIVAYRRSTGQACFQSSHSYG